MKNNKYRIVACYRIPGERRQFHVLVEEDIGFDHNDIHEFLVHEVSFPGTGRCLSGQEVYDFVYEVMNNG